jgi:uncharacterized protein DUF6152
MSRLMVFTVAIWIGAVGLSAHHGYAEYDREHAVSVEGDIAQIVYVNPHVLMTIQTSDAEYAVEWGNLLQLSRWHVAKGTLKAGDHVILTGRAVRDRSIHKLSLVTEIQRPADGWRWSRQIPDVPPPIPNVAR